MLHYKANTMNIKIIFQSSKEIKMYGNQIKFSQLMTNLLLNAIDAYDGVENEATKREVHITLVTQKNEILMQVRDWGVGIPVQNTRQIFQPFFTTESAQK